MVGTFSIANCQLPIASSLQANLPPCVNIQSENRIWQLAISDWQSETQKNA
jgi:hypothetical protein